MSRLNLVARHLVILGIVAMAGLCWSGCSSRNPQAIQDVPVTNKRSYPVEVAVGTAGDSVPVAAADYRSALVTTIANVGAFTGVQNSTSAKISVKVMSVDADNFGFTLSATTNTFWVFTDGAGGNHTSDIVGKSSKSTSDALLGPNRQREAIRGSMEDSIRKGLAWISGLTDGTSK